MQIMQKLGIGMVMAALVMTGPALTADAAMHENDEKKSEDMFAKMDSNNDGTVTRAEFDDAMEKKFEKMDADGDGALSKEECQKAEGHEHGMKMEKKEKSGY